MSSTYYDESYPAALWGPVDLTSLSPTSVVMDTPTPVTVTGTGFTGASRVVVDGDGYPTSYLSPTQVRFIALADSAGTQNIYVLNGHEQSDTLVLTVTATAGGDEPEQAPQEAPTDPPDSPVVPQEAPEAPQDPETPQEPPEAPQAP